MLLHKLSGKSLLRGLLMARVTVDKRKVMSMATDKFHSVNRDYLPNSFKGEITAKKWEWNGNVTVRKNGDTVTTPRDIVDLGTLRDSYRLEQRGLTYRHIWATDYAALVYEGTPRTPARPWGKKPLDDFSEEMSKK